MPIERSQGYLILQNNPNVTHWQIIISSYSYDKRGNLQLSEVKDYNIWVNYIKLDSTFLNNGNYVVSMIGYDNNNVIVVNDGPIQICNECGGSGLNYQNSWKCVADDYAYSMDLYKNHLNEYFVRMEFQAYDFYDQLNQISVPYYEYFSPADYYAIVGNNMSQQALDFGKYHELDSYLSSYYFYPGNGNDPTKVIKLTGVTQQDMIRDINGNLLSGTVYGIQKARGPWAGQFAESNPTISSPGGFGWAMNQLNTNNSVNPGLTPALNCSGTGLEPIDVEPAGLSCEYLENIDWSNVNNIDNLLQLLGCKDADKPLDALANFNIYDFNNDSSIITLTPSDFVDVDGNPVSVSYTLNEGLYMMQTVFKGGQVVQHIAELRQKLVSSNAFKDYLNVLIYPNPIVENSFSMQLTPSANLKVKYELYDFSGNLLYQTNYVLNKDEVVTPLVKLRGTIPSGLLVNRFIFEDGSVLSIQTVKQ